MNPTIWPDLLLLGQEATVIRETASPPAWFFILILSLGGMVFVGAMVILGLRHSQRERELEHRERMKALEMGMHLPKDAPWWTPAKLSAMIGAIVPIVALATAVSASKFPYGGMAWLGAGAVGVAAVICGTHLALRTREFQPGYHPRAYYKPPVDPIEHELSV